MTTVETRDKARGLWAELQPTMERLYGRWLDEWKYEDIKDYARPITPKVEAAGGKIIGMTRRPFGAKIKVDGLTCHISITAREYKIKYLP